MNPNLKVITATHNVSGNHQKEPDNLLEQISITSMESQVKHCAYPSCENTLPLDSEFRVCEVCRVLMNRNAIALMQDPSSPFLERQDEILNRTLENMRAEEWINWSMKMELMYQKVRQYINTHHLEPQKSKTKMLLNQAEEIRLQPKTKTQKKAIVKKVAAKERFKKSFGKDLDDHLKAELEDDANDL